MILCMTLYVNHGGKDVIHFDGVEGQQGMIGTPEKRVYWPLKIDASLDGPGKKYIQSIQLKQDAYIL